MLRPITPLAYASQIVIGMSASCDNVIQRATRSTAIGTRIIQQRSRLVRYSVPANPNTALGHNRHIAAHPTKGTGA